jgi:hypothetical protein
MHEGYVIPVAVEYPFWEERTPEALVRFGEPLDLAAAAKPQAAEWTRRIEEALTASQDALAAEAIQRDPTAFEILALGKAGVGGVYDWWRRLKSWMRGKRFDPAHASPPASAKAEERSA